MQALTRVSKLFKTRKPIGAAELILKHWLTGCTSQSMPKQVDVGIAFLEGGGHTNADSSQRLNVGHGRPPEGPKMAQRRPPEGPSPARGLKKAPGRPKRASGQPKRALKGFPQRTSEAIFLDSAKLLLECLHDVTKSQHQENPKTLSKRSRSLAK